MLDFVWLGAWSIMQYLGKKLDLLSMLRLTNVAATATYTNST